MTGSSWVTHADRARWQQRAARELAVILSGSCGLPLLAWTVGPAGGRLTGRVTGTAARAAFAAWQQALGMDEGHETAVSGGTWLCARAWRGGVRVTVTATVTAVDGNEEVIS